jgi:hypothetical protein
VKKRLIRIGLLNRFKSMSAVNVVVSKHRQSENEASQGLAEVESSTSSNLPTQLQHDTGVILLTKEHFDEYTKDIIEQTSKRVAEEMVFQMQEKNEQILEDKIEMKNRLLHKEIMNSMEQKRLEIAAAEEEKAKEGLLSRWFGIGKNKKQG